MPGSGLGNVPGKCSWLQRKQRASLATGAKCCSGYWRTLSGTSLTFVCIAEGSSERAAHSDVAILQVLQHQILHCDWLPVHLEALALVPGDGAGQDQQVGEQEHVQLLKEFPGKTETFTPEHCLSS